MEAIKSEYHSSPPPPHEGIYEAWCLDTTPGLEVSSRKRSLGDSDQAPNKKQSVGESPMRIPCRARNVPPNHNESNAYFEIPINGFTHGTVLKCSHPECGAGGKRFCWCAVCKKIVSKRNFSKRHDHNLGGNTLDNDDEDDDDNVSGQQEEISTRSGTQEHDNEMPLPADESPPPGGLSQKEVLWLGLLKQRPTSSNTEAMKSWTKHIMATTTEPPKQDSEGFLSHYHNVFDDDGDHDILSTSPQNDSEPPEPCFYVMAVHKMFVEDRLDDAFRNSDGGFYSREARQSVHV